MYLFFFYVPGTVTKCWESKFPKELSVHLWTQSVEMHVNKYLQ